MVEAGELELIEIRYNFLGSWVDAIIAFTDMTKLVEATHFLFHYIVYVWEIRTSCIARIKMVTM